jgi:hypothetical protein
MSEKKALQVVLKFVENINKHDVEGLARLMSANHRFIDSEGTKCSGRKIMKAGWIGYLKWFPDYRISVDRIMQRGDEVGLFGTASGTFCVKNRLLKKNRWKIPGAWRGLVKNGLVAEWQVYADNDSVRRIMERNRS